MPSIGPRKLAGIALKDEMKTVIVAAALAIEHGMLLVTQRKKGSSYELLWEFPGGKVEEGEDPREALRRELYRCRVDKSSLKPIGCHALRWVTPEEFGKLAMPPADDPVRNHLGSYDRNVPLPAKTE
jgi:hypothetical protein